MPPRATNPHSEYPITLSDGTYTIGIMTQSKTGIRRLPRGPGVERQAIKQNNWTGGRGSDRLATDTSRFFESTNLWSTVEGQICNGPLVGITTPQSFQITAGRFPEGEEVTAVTVTATATTLKRSFTPATLSAISVGFIARKTGTPNSLTVKLCESSNNAPGTVLRTVTLAAGDVTDVEMTARTPGFSAQTLTVGSTYWVTFETVVTTAGTWKLLCSGTTPFVRLSAASTDRKKVKFFEYKRGLYALCIYMDGATAAKLLRNGDRGVATGTQTDLTKFTDTSKTWVANEWAGCVLLITAGINKGEYRTIASNTAGGEITLSTPWYKACVAGAGGSEYVILGSAKWTPVLLTSGGTELALAATASDVAVFNNIVYIAQGSDANGTAMYHMQETNTAGVWTIEAGADGSNKADYLVAAQHWNAEALPAIWIARNVDTMIQVAPKVTYGTNLTFEAGMPCGETESNINSILEYSGQIYCGKDDSVWQGKEGSFKKLPIGIDKARDERNGLSMIWWNTQIFVSFMGGLERLYGTTLDDIGPDRDQGMLAGRRGNIVDMVNVANMLYCSYSSRTGQSCVLVTTDPGGDWHNLYTRGGVAWSAKLSGLFYQTVPDKTNRLWFADRYNFWYAIMPDELHNPVRDSNMRYAWESFLTTSWIDADSPELDHYFDELRLSTKNVNGTTHNIEIEYQLDNAVYEDAWVAFPATTMTGNTSGYFKIPVGDGNVTGRSIRFRFRLTCNCLTPVILKSFELRLNTMHEVLYDYLFDLNIEDRLELLNASDTVDKWGTMMAILESWKEDATPLTLRTPMPGTSGVIDNIRGHIDPVSLVTAEWNDQTTTLSGQIVFKQT